LYEEKKTVDVDEDQDKLQPEDVYKMLHIEKSKNVHKNRE